jgi:hypothetical protein
MPARAPAQARAAAGASTGCRATVANSSALAGDRASKNLRLKEAILTLIAGNLDHTVEFYSRKIRYPADSRIRSPKWKAEYSEALRGARLIVFNDNDAPGHAHAEAVCRLSVGVAKRIRRLDLAPHWPAIPKGGDVSDWLAAGADHTPERLLELIGAAPDYVPAEPSASGEASVGEAPSQDDEAELERLARMSAWDYERTRAEASKRLGVRAAMLDKLVAAKRTELDLDADDGRQGHAVSLPEPEPWAEPVDGGTMLTELATTIRRYIVMSAAAGDTIALWITHTYCSDRFLISPRLAVLSATKQCGKTVTLDVLTHLVWRPLPAINATVAALFRTIEEFRPTLLLDEADTFLTGDNEELRGLINGGYRQGATVLRVEGDDHQVKAFRTFAPCAIGAIGALPATVMDRSIVINLVRRKADEPIEPFRLDRTEVFDVLARKVSRWVKDNADAISACEPEPSGLYNRVFDNWKGLLQIADIAAGDWPVRARQAAMAGAPDIDEASRLELLLGDVRDIFNKQRVDRIAGAALIEELCKITPERIRPSG